MQTFFELVENATLQAWIWGPLMGVILGAVFTGLTGAPAVNAPLTVNQTRYVYNTRVIVNQNHSGSRGADDNGAIFGVFIAAGIGLIFLVWKYAIHVDLVHEYLWMLLSTLLGFCVTAALLSLINGQFTSGSWALYILAPIMLLCVCGHHLWLAKASLDPELTRLASTNTFMDFYFKRLSHFGQQLMICQVLGVAVVFLVMLFTGLALLHYLALMNQRSPGRLQGFWMFLTGITRGFSGRLWLFVLAAGLVLSDMLIEPGLIPTWLTRQ